MANGINRHNFISEMGGGAKIRTKNSKGFTLIELLVVISIIALLLSVLIPSLAAAKKRAQGVICLSNLRQIGMAANGYAIDNKGRVPRAEGANNELLWFVRFLPYVGHSSEITDYKQVDIYKCKAFPRTGTGLDDIPNSRQTVCYVVNASSDDVPEAQTHEPVRLTSIRGPASVAYLMDNEAGPWRPIIEDENSPNIILIDVFHSGHLPTSDNRNITYGRRIARGRHGEGCNVLFFDWHAEQMDPEDITMATLRIK